MTKLTIVTDRRGKLIGAVQGHELSEKAGEVEAHVSFAAGHKLHKIDVDIDLDDENTDPKKFERTLARHIPKSAAKLKVKSPRKKTPPRKPARA
jgi:hypothetical protein